MTDTQNGFNILSLNVYYGRLSEELTLFIEDRKRSVAVFCLQETCDEARARLDTILLDDFTGYHASKEGKSETHYVSMYVRDDINVIDIMTVYADIEGAGFALRAKLIDSQGFQATITSVYGTPQPGHKLDTPERLGLSRQLIRLAQKSATVEVMAGDFNLLPETDSVRMFSAAGFHDLIEEFGISTTRNELAWQKFPAHMKQLFADYTFVRGENIDYDFAVDNVIVSDHLPMLVRVSRDLSRHKAQQTGTRVHSLQAGV